MRNKGSGMRKDVDNSVRKSMGEYGEQGEYGQTNTRRKADRRTGSRRKTPTTNTGGASVGGGT